MSIETNKVVKCESINVKFPGIIELDMDLRSFNLLTGLNGSGKSFANILMWISNFVIHAYAETYKATKKDPINMVGQLFQFAIDNCLKDTSVLTGEFGIVMTDGSNAKCCLKNGKVASVVANLTIVDDNFPQISKALYLTSNMRLYDNIEKYLSIKDMICKGGSLGENEIIKLCKFYRFHEIFTTEAILGGFPKTISDTVKDAYPELKDFDRLYINSSNDAIVVKMSDGTDKIASNFSNGIQALLMQITLF